MSDTNELQAAVDRLRRVRAREDKLAVYVHADADDLIKIGCAEYGYHRDLETLADAYLELGERQPVEQVTWNDDGTMTLIVRGHVEPARNGDSIVYIHAAEVSNAG